MKIKWLALLFAVAPLVNASMVEASANVGVIGCTPSLIPGGFCTEDFMLGDSNADAMVDWSEPENSSNAIANGNAEATADLTRGALGVSALVEGDSHFREVDLIAHALASYSNTLTFVVSQPKSFALFDTINLGFSGSLTNLGAASFSISLSEPGTSWSELLSCQFTVFSACDVGDLSNTLAPFEDRNDALRYIIPIPVSNHSQIAFTETLGALANKGDAVNFSHTVTTRVTNADGVTWTSDSGLFLSNVQDTPEPSTGFLFLFFTVPVTGFSCFCRARGLKRPTGIVRRAASPEGRENEMESCAG